MKRLRFIGLALAALAATIEVASAQLPVNGGPTSYSAPMYLGGHVLFPGAVPSVSACGTGALAAGSTDISGEVTATGATGCAVTFAQPFNSAPSCQVTDETGTRASAALAVTATGFTVSGLTSGDKFSYFCPAKLGF